MPKHIDLVRYRNDGDDFHVLWTARRVLRLLEPTSNLVAVAVEGISENESGDGPDVEAGQLVIDTTEYYGSETIADAVQIVYCQLKYSTTASDEPWTLSGLKKTLIGFAGRFKEYCSKFPANVVVSKIRFRFISNRPIAEIVAKAFEVSAVKTPTGKLSSDIKSIILSLRKATGLSANEFQSFAAQVDLWGDQESRPEQSSSLQAETKRITPTLDFDVLYRMKELVRSKTLSDTKNNNTIRLNSLERVFGLDRELLPAKPLFEKVPHPIPRIQENDIVETILRAQWPVIIHAAGGIGKSVLAQRLPELLPPNSEAVIFDGFARGAYRSPLDRRHKHELGLVQIANTLAIRGLCDILLPTPASEEAYLLAFRNRLEQAVAVVRSRSSEAILLIVLDAADNSVKASQIHHDYCFIPALLQDPPPEGCRIVALARSHRVDDHLHPSSQAICISLEPFTLNESGEHLRSKFPNASDEDIEAFHRFTDNNPRVQANALALSGDLSELLTGLGPSIQSVENLIEGQLKAALDRVIEDQACLQVEIDSLCIALASLPPLVPIRVLAMASGISVDAIRSFASDFAGGRPVMIHDDSVQFRDEPVETWFHETFTARPEQYDCIVNLLTSLALKDGYIASALPSLLWCAGRYNELVNLALRGEELETDDPVEKREMLLRRVQYALKAALKNLNFEDCTKLLLRIAEEVATSDRQSSFLMDHSDLVAALAGPEVVYDFVFRKRVWNMSSTPYVHSAAMLAANRQHKVESRRFLDLSLDWLREWSASEDPERVEVEADDIAAYTYAIFLLDGPPAAAAFLARWTPRTLSFEAGSILASRLIDTGNIDLTQNLLSAAKGDIYLRLAIILELSRVCLLPSEEQIVSSFNLLEEETPPINISEISEKIDIGLAVVALAEMAARIGVQIARITAILNCYQHVPTRAYYNFDRNWFREAVLRAASLKAALEGRDITLDDVVPTSVAEKMEKPNSDHIREVREFKEVYGALVPWYRLRAQALLNGYGIDRYDSLLVVAQKDCGINHWSWRGNHELTYAANEISRVWLEALILSGCANAETTNNFEGWLAAQKIFIYTPTWTHLARCAAHHPEIHAAALNFAGRARELIAGDHGDARQTADNFAALSRATFPIAHKEAVGYFQLALEHLNRLGEELHERLRCLMEIANHAALTGQAQPREAYRFARVVELFHAYNDHKFPWPDAGETAENLCATSGIAIISRWNDRDKGWLNDIFPPVIISLLKKGIITPQVATALHVFPGYWRLHETASLFFDKTADATLLQDILDTLVLDQEYEGNKESASKALLDIARHHRLICDRLEEQEAFYAASLAKADNCQNDASTKYTYAPSQKQKEPDWNSILATANFDTPEGIETAAERSKLGTNHYPWKEFFQKLRTSIAPAKWPDHILALSKSQISEFLLLDAIEAAATEWKSSEAVKRATAQAIKSIITNRPHGFLSHGWGVGKEIERCTRLAGMTNGQIYEALLIALSDHIEAISAEALFLLTSSLTQDVLAPEQALRTLTFSLDRLEPILKDDDGDGPWHAALAPPEVMSQAIAGFLYSMLGSHKSENRWRAAHAVRRLCKFREHDIITTLVNLLPAQEIPSFTDAELPFYTWHARLYLMISFARSSVETPDALLPYLPSFLYWALEGPPHVLIRHYAAQTALAILQMFPDRCEPVILENLRKVNVSHYATVPEQRGQGVGWHMPRGGKTDYLFPHDFDRYWLGPLSEVFNSEYHEVAQRAESWIISNRKSNFNGGWDEDPRGRRNYYRDMDTMCGSSSCPELDTYSFYLSYHALFCTAGELLAEKPTVKPEDWHGGWDKWLKEHLLTRPDGKWLSDRRDFAPLERQRWQVTNLPWDRETEWRWSILAEDFDRALGFTESTPDILTIGGYWNVCENFRREDIHVSSALVTSKTSLALLRALQTVDDFHDFKIPDENERFETVEQGFKMSGWTQEPYCEFGFDKHDPLSGKIPWPGLRPGRRVTRMFKLIQDEEGRTWRAADSEVIWSRIWGDRKEDRHNRAGNYGQRLMIDVSFLLVMLQRLNRDLIVEVEIKRDKDKDWGNDKEEKLEYKYRSYTRIYLVRFNGELHTLRGCRCLRPKAD